MVAQGDLWLAGTARKHSSDAMNGDACDSLRNFRAWRCGEKQFVIFAAVQGQIESRWRAPCAHSFGSERMDWDGCGVEFSREARFMTDMGQVGGEAVADVDSRVSQSRGSQLCGSREARLGK